MGQTVLTGLEGVEGYLRAGGAAHILLVCGPSIRFLELDGFFRELPGRTGIRVTRFGGFAPNPGYGSVAEGVRLFQRAGCDFVAAVGGGSAMDVAKCIRLYGRADPAGDFLAREPEPGGTGLLAVPTTAGSGSEATRFAVIYRDGEKRSIEHRACLPDAVLLDPRVLRPLPEYQRKCTMLDALCHALESIWCVNATGESRAYAQGAIRTLLSAQGPYLRNEEEGNAAMQRAAYAAGQAINLTKTTAGHAMAYGLTTRYGLAHGHAAALCVDALWPYMLEHTQRCTAPGGPARLRAAFAEIAAAMGCGTAEEAAGCFHGLLDGLSLERPAACEADIPALCGGVNAERLQNNPVPLGREALERLYRRILL